MNGFYLHLGNRRLGIFVLYLVVFVYPEFRFIFAGNLVSAHCII